MLNVLTYFAVLASSLFQSTAFNFPKIVPSFSKPILHLASSDSGVSDVTLKKKAWYPVKPEEALLTQYDALVRAAFIRHGKRSLYSSLPVMCDSSYILKFTCII